MELPFWFTTKNSGLTLPVIACPIPGYEEIIMRKLGVSSEDEIKLLAEQIGIDFTAFCISVYNAKIKIVL